MTRAHAEPTQRQFLTLAVPNIISGLSMALAGLTDIAYLGQLSDIAPLGGVVLATIIFDYLYWGFAFLRMGTTGPTATALGANDADEQAAIFWRALLMGLGFGAILTAAQYPIGALGFMLLHSTPEINAAARDYYDILIWSMVPGLGVTATTGWLLGMHRAGSAMLVMLVMNVGNIVFNYIFILEMGMGAYGAGLGTLISVGLGFLLSLVLVVRTWRGIPPYRAAQIYCRDKWRDLVALNGNIVLRTMTITTVLAIFTQTSATLGPATLAANALLMRLFLFFAFFADGYTTALESLAGKYHGAGQPEKLARSLKLSLHWTFGTALLFALGMLAGDNFLLGLINKQADVIAIASTFLPYMCLSIVIASASFVYDGLFFGLARGKPLRNSVLAGALTFLPCAALAHHLHNNLLLYVGLFVFVAMRGIVLYRPVQRVIQS